MKLLIYNKISLSVNFTVRVVISCLSINISRLHWKWSLLALLTTNKDGLSCVSTQYISQPYLAKYLAENSGCFIHLLAFSISRTSLPPFRRSSDDTWLIHQRCAAWLALGVGNWIKFPFSWDVTSSELQLIDTIS